MAKLKVIGREELSECRGDQINVTSSPYTMTKEDYVLVAREGAWVVNLPLAATCNGYSFYLKLLGATSLLICPSSKPVDPDVPEATAPEKIDGIGGTITVAAGETYHLYSDGSEFFILGSIG